MDAEHCASQSKSPINRWLVWAGWLGVIGIAICAVLSSIEVDQLGF